MAGTKGQDHPASAGPRSSPSAIDNTTETLPGPPITGSSNVVTPRKDEIEQHVDPNLDASRTHQCDKAPLSESQNTLRKSEGEDVNAHPNVSGATQCDEPLSSGSSNLSVKSEGEHVDVNPNVSEAPSSSSSTGVTKPDVIRRIKHIDQADNGKEMDVDLDELVDHISELLKLREEEMLADKKASNPRNFPWPEGFKKLNVILSYGTDLKNLKELLSSGLDFASTLKDVISGPVTTILKAAGQASVVTSGLLVVAYTLERFQDLSDNKDECWGLIKEMSQLASVVKELNERPKETFNVIEEATTLVVEGAITCCTQLSHSGWKRFLLASKDKADLSGITQKLNSMYLKISVDIGIRNLSAIERVLASNDNQAKRNSANFERVVAAMDNQKENLWTSLQLLNLSGCGQLEGKSMDHVVKMNRLQVVHIEGRKQLVDRWAEIQRDGGGSWSFPVISGQDLSISRVEKENIEKSLLLELDGLLTNRRGEDFHLSQLPPNTLILVTWELESIIEEMIDEMQIRVIYIGTHFDKFSTKVKDNIFVVDVPTTRATQMLEKVHLTLNLAPDKFRRKKYLQIDTRMQVGDEYRPCWRFLEEDEMKEFVVSNCKRYLRLKQLEADRDEESSNIELLRELFAARGDERTPVFQKNESSVQQDPTANSEVKATCGVDKLEGKTILLEMRPPHSLFYDIRLPSLKKMYLLEKERLNFEIISIPLLKPRDVSYVIDVYKQFSSEVPWLVLQNPWTTITREVQYFLDKQYTGREEGDACEKWYPTINWVIDPNGRITIYRPPISPGDMRDRGEVFEVFFKYLESESYQVRWGVNASLTTLGEIEEVRKNEWQQLKNMSTLEFLFNHLESVSVQVKSLMRQGKIICFFHGSAYAVTLFMRSAMEQFGDSIHFIHFIHELREFPLENTSREYYHPLENTSEMEGTSLSRHETVRFIMRLRHLEEEMNGMDQSDEQLCELKTILHSLLFKSTAYLDNGSFTFFDKVGKMVGAVKGDNISSIFYSADRRDKVQRLINSMLKEGGKEMHDEDSSLIRKMQTASASAVEQENADVYFDALRDYISELWAVELYQLCKLNKEGKKRSPPRVTWPTSRGLCRLKNLLSEGQNEDWVKDVISRPSEEDALNTVVKSLVKDIRVAEWAVAGLLAVADLLERFETVPSCQVGIGLRRFETGPSSRIGWLFVLEEMFRLAQYSKQFNQKAELWRRMKCGAIVVILRYSIICCWNIDQSKFAFSRRKGSNFRLYKAEKDIREECDTLAQKMMEDLDNESGSLSNLDCYKWGFDLFAQSEGEGEGGPSSEYKRSASFPDLLLESEDEGGPSSEYKRSASFPDLLLESEDEGGPSSEYKRSASFPFAGSTVSTGEEKSMYLLRSSSNAKGQ